MSIREYMECCPVHREAPEGFTLSGVEVRLATPAERPLWDALMDGHHYLGFRRLAGRGLRYVATFGDRWLGLAAWQNGAFKCAPRDRWVGWRPAQQFRRLEMVANNTRFLILSDPGVFPNLASRFLSLMTRRLSDDWLDAHGHRVLLAETFCDPALFPGTMYRAAGWEGLGETKGYARANGRYTDPHGRPKEIFVTPLRPDARALLSDPRPLPADVAPPAGPGLAPRAPSVMRSLHAELAAVPADLPDIHPNIADIYRRKVARLAEALNHPEDRDAAASAIRGLIERIVLTPSEKWAEMNAVLHGDLGAILEWAGNGSENTRTDIL